MIHLSPAELLFIVDALNAYWNDAHRHLTEKHNLGDIEKKQLESRLMRAKTLIKKINPNA